MNKKFLFGMFATATMLLATSCSNDEFDAVLSDNESVVSFTLEQPGIATRAYSDGLTATQLTYAVYDKSSTSAEPIILSEKEVTFVNKKAKVDLRLVNGSEYDILFWVDAEKSPYTFNGATKSISVDYTDAVNNDESRDAFYSAKTIKVEKPITETITLYRPFAQLNLGTTDAKEASVVEFAPAKTSVKMKVYNTLNLLEGTVSGEAEQIFALADIPADTETFPVTGITGVKYLSMSYLLASNDKEVKDVEFVVSNKNASRTITREYTNVPVQRNFRTNIYGNLLTDQANFNIVIESNYEQPEKLVIVSDKASFANDLATINASNATDVTIILSEDIEISTLGTNGNSYLLTRDSVNLTINGAGHTITAIGAGVASICGSEGGSLTIKDATIADKSQSYNEGSWEFGYLELGGDLTLEKCNITNAIQFKGTSLVVNDCKFDSNNENEYALWIYNGTAEINDSYFTGDRGIKICDYYEGADVTSVVIDGCTFEDLTKKPGVAIDEKQGETMAVTIKNSTFTNTQPGEQDNYIYETDNVVPTLENNTVTVVEQITDGVKYYKANNAYEISNENGMKWLANEANVNNNYFEGKTINIVENITLTENWTPICSESTDNRFKGTIDGLGHTITGLKIKVADNAALIGSLHRDGVIKNLTIVEPEIENTGKAWAAAFVAYAFGDVINCHVVGGTISSTNHNNATGAGGICGAAYQSVMGCTAKNVSLFSKGRNVGGVVASYGAYDNVYHPKYAITACYAENVSMNSSHNVREDLPYYGGITSGSDGLL